MTHPLLTGDQDPPDEWEGGWIGGTYISFKRPAGGGEDHYVVISQGGEHDDGVESRPVEVWAATMREGPFLRGGRGAGETIGEGVGMSEGAAIALEYMEDDAE